MYLRLIKAIQEEMKFIFYSFKIVELNSVDGRFNEEKQFL